MPRPAPNVHYLFNMSPSLLQAPPANLDFVLHLAPHLSRGLVLSQPLVDDRVGFPKQTGCSRRTVNRGRRAPDSCRRRRRLVALDERGVTFRYKDYRLSGPARYCTMTLAPDEFIRRFLLHVLPKGFHRIRHYGLLASASCKANIARARQLMAAPMLGGSSSI